MYYGYIAGYDMDELDPGNNLVSQLKQLISWHYNPDRIYFDRFHEGHTERRGLRYLMLNVAKPGDVITATFTYNFASSIREFVSLLELAKDKGIIFTAYDLDFDPSDDRHSNELYAIQLMAGFEAHIIKQRLQAIKRQKKLDYKESLNTGGRNKRVITKQYRQAYEYLQGHTYRETEAKFKLSKATLYRIKQQIEGNQ